MLSARTSKVLKPWATSKGAAAGVRLRRFVDFLDSHNPNDNEFTKP
jgi:predicted transglutaminase-like cysteine proteinase